MWVAYSLFFAFWTSIGILILKRLTPNFKPASLTLIGNLFTIPCMLILILVLFQIPQTTIEFYKLILISAVFDSIAAITYFKALTISPISLISPISSFNPIFTLIFASIFLNENPTPIKLLGIVVIVLGSYLLNLSSIKKGLLKPLTDLFSNRGVQLFLVANLIWGLTPIFQKQAIFETTPQVPLFAALIGGVIVSILIFPLAFKEKVYRVPIKKYSKWFLILGPMTALATLAAFTAFTLTNVAYVTAIFKLSTLFTVILGAVFLHEKRIKERFLGAAVMVAGTILIAI